MASTQQHAQPGDVVFAGLMMTCNDEYVFVGHPPPHGGPAGSIAVYGTTALPRQDAFLVRLDWGWRFVAGPSTSGPRWRTCFDDMEPGSTERATALAELGAIPVVTWEDAKLNVERHGLPVMTWPHLAARR